MPDRVFNTSHGQAIYRSNGQLRTLSTNGMVVHRAANGLRIVSVDRPDHSHVVVLPGGGGWVQQPFTYGNTTYGRRTYVMHGVTYDRFYRQTGYRGVMLNVYAPVHYYRPAFYIWAAQPWGLRVAYNWGWRGRPWYARYGGAFAPYPYYAGPSMWMTDYLLSTTMEAAYQQDYSNQMVMPLSPYAKAQIDDEVDRQTLAMRDDADRQTRGLPVDPNSGSISEVLASNKPHTFVAGSELLVVDGGGEECALSPGDSVRLTPAPRDQSATTVDVEVLWGKGAQDCRTGSTVTIALQDLQEMQNYMRASIDQGLDKLHADQANGTVPPAPADANGPSTSQAFLANAPSADTTAQVEVDVQSREADAAERNATKP